MDSEQADVSIKYLLKQVYAAHVSKVKGLDEEIEELKNKLLEADRKAKHEIDCKRCVELEEAFKSCKAALNEQSKWFENLGQKISVFDGSENKALGKNSRSLSLDDIKVQADISSNQELSNLVSEKSSANGQNILNNLLNLNCDRSQNSLGLCSVPFSQQLGCDYSTLNCDSLILAPDTVDISDATSVQNEKNKKGGFEYLWTTKPKIAFAKGSKEFIDEIKNTSGNLREGKEDNRQIKKRPFTESSTCKTNSKRVSKDNVTDLSFVKSTIKQTSEMENQDPQLQGDLGKMSKVAMNNAIKIASIEKIEVNILNPQNSNDVLISSVKKYDTAIDEGRKKEHQTIPTNVEILKDTSALDQTDNLNAKKKVFSSTKGYNVISGDGKHEVSPSLLPLNKSSKPVLDQHEFLPEDINDFQSPILNKKHVQGDGAWTACDKKKLKKRQHVKILKSTSKFKMHLDSLPPNYKKPTYRQTKLSASIFQPKASTSSSDTKTVQVLENYNSSSSSEESDNILTPGTPVQSTIKTGVIDFDATCIPDNYEIISSGSIRKKITDEKFDSVDVVVVGINESSNDSSSTSPLNRDISKQSAKKNDSNDSAVFEDFISIKKETANNAHLNSFDRLPKKAEPNYKYKEETVRTKAERKQLNGFDCKECENYYSELGLSDKEKQERLKKCSRHRAKFAPPATPEHFWELEFPDTQECKARGYLNETQKVQLKSRRRRPLDL